MHEAKPIRDRQKEIKRIILIQYQKGKMTHHKVPSTSNTMPFRGGAVDVSEEPRGANFRGRSCLQAIADMMERATCMDIRERKPGG
jgi:hypothetical protein